jgi:hypothetical protein
MTSVPLLVTALGKGGVRMATVTTSTVKRRDWHSIVFRVVTVLAALFFLTNFRLVLAPWLLLPADEGILHPEIHRWHDAEQGAIGGILGAGILLVLLWRPRANPLLVQYTATMVVVGLLITAPFIGPSMFLITLPLILVVATYPAPRALLDFSGDEPISLPLLALTLIAAVLLALSMWRSLLWQIQGVGGEHATAYHWIATFEHTIILLLAGVLASTKRPGWQTLGILTGVVFLYLGLVALSVPDQAGSWGIIGGILGLVGGAGYIGATLFETHRTVQMAAAAQRTA